MSSGRIQRDNQVILISDLRDFSSTFSLVSHNNSQNGSNNDDDFYSYMDFYLKSVFELLVVVLEFVNGRPLDDKKDITPNLLFNSTGDGVVLVIGGSPPENVISSYIYSFYLDCLLRKFSKRLEKEFNLPSLKKRVGIAMAFGSVTAIQYRYRFNTSAQDASSFYHISSLISKKINIASRVESSNKDHINSDISLDSSFVDQLYRFMFPSQKLPGRLMKDFKNFKTKHERLEAINRLNSNDIVLLLNYLGHHYFKGGDTVVHIVSPVLVNIDTDLENNRLIESEELIEFYSSVNDRMERDLHKELLNPLRTRLLELVKELEEL